jgi:hypothetical protein
MTAADQPQLASPGGARKRAATFAVKTMHSLSTTRPEQDHHQSPSRLARADKALASCSKTAAESRAYQAGSRFRRRTVDRNNRTGGTCAWLGPQPLPISRLA